MTEEEIMLRDDCEEAARTIHTRATVRNSVLLGCTTSNPQHPLYCMKSWTVPTWVFKKGTKLRKKRENEKHKRLREKVRRREICGENSGMFTFTG